MKLSCGERSHLAAYYLPYEVLYSERQVCPLATLEDLWCAASVIIEGELEGSVVASVRQKHHELLFLVCLDSALC